MKHYTLTGKTVEEMMRKAITDRGPAWNYLEAFPDHPTCYYLEHDDDTDKYEPCCLIGKMLFDLDPDLVPWLLDHNDSNVLGLLGLDAFGPRPRHVFDWVAEGVRLTVYPDALKAMYTAQVAQDSGSEWGESYEQAFGVPFKVGS